MDEQNRPDNSWSQTDQPQPQNRQEEILSRFGDHYWRKEYEGGDDVVSSVVRTILSQNQQDSVSYPAGKRLIDKHGRGDDMVESICETSEDEIADTIYPCGPHHQKAGFIKNWCQFVRDEFQTVEQLESFIRRHPVDQVRDTLTHPSGVGRKTVDVVLTFTVGKDGVFAVDTHVHRVAKRLALVPESASRNMTADILEQKVSGDMCGWSHTTMIKHGREVCSAQSPDCDECFIQDECPQIGLED